MIKERYIGVDLGGTKLLCGLFDRDLKMFHSVRTRTPGTNKGDEIKDLIVALIRQLLAESASDINQVQSIGVGVPGAVNAKDGVVLDTPNIGFRDYPLRKNLQSVFAVPIFIENDVNAGIYGEFKKGVAKGGKNIVGLYPGSGIGGGIIINGKLYRGNTGSAGEIGHMRIQDGGRVCGCGRYGCLETVASKNALARDLVSLAATGKAPTIYENAGTDFAKIRSGVIRKAVKAGESEVIKAVERLAFYLGIGMANCVNIFDPELIVLGGGLVEKLTEEILPVAEKSMREHAQAHIVKQVKVLAASLGDESVITGCAALALEASVSV